MRRLLTTALIMLGPGVAAAQQPQQPDTGIMAALLGQCTYRDALTQAQLREARETAAALAAYWAAWTGETDKKVGAR